MEGGVGSVGICAGSDRAESAMSLTSSRISI